ncbi:MAG: C25 family cysteine peptidase, partial [Chloroflexi bacterium]|nr:C25 family cysteine peptidase [Chloroflexota bacterium]
YADWVDRQLLAPGDGFRARQMTPYHEGPAGNDRNLVPSVATLTTAGQAAADDWFVTDDLGDLLPAIAIGRVPVTEPAELAAVIDKTIASANAPVGPWRRRVLWITNEEAAMQQFTDRAVARLAARGFVPTKVYPRPEERSNAGHQQKILDSFATGQSLVQFTGHGGRFIWRTGPPDPLKNHDLFTLEHLDALAPSTRLPVVVSHSCHTAPFDHPSADSIGERFLRLADRGAPAVVAASWRIVPLPGLVEGFAGELTRPGTVGEALARAKRSLAAPELTATYNLLGDPALPTPVPQHELVVELLPAAVDAPRRLSARLPGESFRGRARVEWLDESGASLAHEERGVEGVEAFFAPPAVDGLRWASVYFWDETSGFDALGGLDLLLSSPQPSASR